MGSVHRSVHIMLCRGGFTFFTVKREEQGKSQCFLQSWTTTLGEVLQKSQQPSLPHLSAQRFVAGCCESDGHRIGVRLAQPHQRHIVPVSPHVTMCPPDPGHQPPGPGKGTTGPAGGPGPRKGKLHIPINVSTPDLMKFEPWAWFESLW